jgi:hypothetical protein
MRELLGDTKDSSDDESAIGQSAGSNLTFGERILPGVFLVSTILILILMELYTVRIIGW